MFPRLDTRLQTVADQIRSNVHADVGSDHGYLLRTLLSSGRIERGIAIENKQQPHANSLKTLQGFNASVRFADGLAGLTVGEAGSLSICGMGGRSIARVLNAHPNRVPELVVLQPNCETEVVRQWGLSAGFHLVDEFEVGERRVFDVLNFKRGVHGSDPAYRGISREAAIRFGPHHLKRWSPEFVSRLHTQRDYLQQLEGRNPQTQQKLDLISTVLK